MSSPYVPSWETTGQKNAMWSSNANRKAGNNAKRNATRLSTWGKNRAMTAWNVSKGKSANNRSVLGKSAGTGCFKKGSNGKVVCGVTRNAAALMGGRKSRKGRSKNKTKKNRNKNKNKKNKSRKNRH